MEVDEDDSSSGTEPLMTAPGSGDAGGGGEWLQKVNKLQAYLPKKEEIEAVRRRFLGNLKEKMLSVALEQGEPLSQWILAMDKYLTNFGYAFTKEEHVLFIRASLQTLDGMDQDFTLMLKLIKMTSVLLKKTYLLSRDDLTLDWRLFYRLITKTYHNPYHKTAGVLSFGHDLVTKLNTLIRYASPYFTVESTSEMLAQWRQYLCPYSPKVYKQYLSICSVFLPTVPYPGHPQEGFTLWFEEFLKLWIELPNNSANGALLVMLSNLACDAKGFIDWEPYLPLIMERFMTCLHVDAKKNANSLELYTRWLIFAISDSSSALQHLRQLFRMRSVNFFISKSKTDHLFQSVLTKSLVLFTKRLQQERYKKKSWFEGAVPRTALLTEATIELFASLMLETVEKINLPSFYFITLHRLCSLASPQLPERVLAKLDLAYEQLSEPKRLLSALEMFAISLYPIVANGNAQYRTYVGPILSNLALTLNTNEGDLCYLQLFTIRSILLLGIPLRDVSGLVNAPEAANLEESTVQLLLDSVQLEDFAYQYLSCCFTIMESNNEDLFKLEKKGITFKDLLGESFFAVLQQSSPRNVKTILDKLFTYATTRIIENKETIKVLQELISVASLVNPVYSMEKFFRPVAAQTHSIIENVKSAASVTGKSEFIYNIYLLYEILNVVDGTALLPYQEEIVALLGAIYSIDYEEDFRKTFGLLMTLLFSLTRVCRIAKLNEAEPFKNVANWPQTYHIEDVPIYWHLPNDQEIAFARRLYTTFVRSAMDKLHAWASTPSLELSKSQLETNLRLVLTAYGLMECMPSFSKEDDADASATYLESNLSFAVHGEIFGERNFKDDAIGLMGAVLKRVTTIDENASLLGDIVRIYEFFFFACYYTGDGFDIHKLYQPLTFEHVYPAEVHRKRLFNYQTKLQGNLKSYSDQKWSASHAAAISPLVTLATCRNVTVRTSAQSVLARFVSAFPRQTTSRMMPEILRNLATIDASDASESAFKGTMYLLFGSPFESVFFHPTDVSSLSLLWPLLIKANFADKSKILAKFDYQMFPLISLLFTSIALKRNHLSGAFSSLVGDAAEAGFTVPDGEFVASTEEKIKQWNAENEEEYRSAIDGIIQALTENKLHWRFHTLGVFLLTLLIRHDLPPSRPLIDLFLDNLVHESIHVRRTAVLGLKKVLFLNRPPRESVEVSYGQPSQADVWSSEETYSSVLFHDKPYAGYYPDAPVYSVKKPKAPGQTAGNGFIAERFKDEAYLDKIFDLYSVENSQSIDQDFVKVWKYLFQSYQLFNGTTLFPRISGLLEKDKHSFDKLAIEIMAGLTRSLPWLAYSDALQAKSFLAGIVTTRLGSFNSESSALWRTFVRAFFQSRDLRRSGWLLSHLLAESLQETTSPYYSNAYLSFLTKNLDGNLKAAHLWPEILRLLEGQLSHPYENVRRAIAGVLEVVFPIKMGLNISTDDALNSRRPAFVGRIVARLEGTMSSLWVSLDSAEAANMPTVKSAIFDADTEPGRRLLHLIETVCYWTRSSLLSAELVKPVELVELLPLLCLVQLNNPSMQSTVTGVITKIGKQTYPQADLPVILAVVERVSRNWNWHSRKQVVLFLQHFFYANIFALTRAQPLTATLLGTLCRLLEDEVIEVREAASLTLGSFLIWNALPASTRDRLIGDFKEKASKKIRRQKGEDGQRVANGGDLRVKHGGILGLAAFLYAAPDDLPEHLPGILLCLTEHQTDPHPIPKSITTALNSFKRFHLANWIEYKHKFTADQLIELNNVLISPSYYA